MNDVTPTDENLRDEHLASKKSLALARERAREAKRPKRPEDRHKYTNVARLKKMATEIMATYQCTAIDAIADLAMMDADVWQKSPALAQIKLSAARLLAYPDGQKESESPLGDMLKQLDGEFKANAPRIKNVRERVITFDSEPRVIAEQS